MIKKNIIGSRLGEELMDNVTLFYVFFMFITASVVTFWAIKSLLKKDLINSLKTTQAKKDKLNQHKKGFTIFMKSILTFYIIISSVYIIIPGMLDIPRIFFDDYEKEICTIEESYEYKTDLWVHLTKENGEELSLMVLDRNYQKGEKYLVCYLPHIKCGTLTYYDGSDSVTQKFNIIPIQTES